MGEEIAKASKVPLKKRGEKKRREIKEGEESVEKEGSSKRVEKKRP